MANILPVLSLIHHLWIFVWVTLPSRSSLVQSETPPDEKRFDQHWSFASLSDHTAVVSRGYSADHMRVRRSNPKGFGGMKKLFSRKFDNSANSKDSAKRDVFRAMFQPQFQDRFDTMSRMGSKSQTLDSGFASIEKAISGVDKTSDVYHPQPEARFGNSKAGPGEERSVGAVTPELFREPGQRVRQADTGAAQSRSGRIVSDSFRPKLLAGGQGKSSHDAEFKSGEIGLAEKASENKTLRLAGGRFQADDVHINPGETFIKPTAPAPSYADGHTDMKDLFFDSFLPYVDPESQDTPGLEPDTKGFDPIENSNTHNSNERHSSKTNNEKSGNIDNINDNTSPDLPQFGKDTVSQVADTFQQPGVRYKNSRVLHPPSSFSSSSSSSSSHYPAYPVFEEALVTSDSETMEKLMKNVHKAEKKAQKLLDGSFR